MNVMSSLSLVESLGASVLLGLLDVVFDSEVSGDLEERGVVVADVLFGLDDELVRMVG